MKTLLVLLLASSAAWADTLVSGSSSFDTNIVPFNSESSFDLVLAGGSITSLDVFNGYQQGAKGGTNQNYTVPGIFTVDVVPFNEVQTIGIPTDFSIVIDGVTYGQGDVPGKTSGSYITPPAGSSLTVTIDLTPISGTNIVDTSQSSTASGLFCVTGSVEVGIENGTYFNPLPGATVYTAKFSGYAAFNGSYTPNDVLPPFFEPEPVLMETYGYTPAPEPATIIAIVPVLGCLLFAEVIRRRRVRLQTTAERSNAAWVPAE